MRRPTCILLMLFLGSTAATAADEMISAKITQVDAEKGTIQVSVAGSRAKSYDVVKKAKIELNGKAATLKGLGAGLTATLTYNKDLEVITGISATGKIVANPELIELSELPGGSHLNGPKTTADGKTLYFGTFDENQKKWTSQVATRKSVEVLFGDVKPLFQGQHICVSSDGSEVYFLSNGLNVSKRDFKDGSFTRPESVSEFSGVKMRNPSLSNNDLTLYYATPSAIPGGGLVLNRATRSKRTEKWGKSEVVKVSGAEKSFSGHSVSYDGKYLFVNRDAPIEESDILVLTLAKDGRSFEEPRVLDIGKQPVRGELIHWNSSTKELFTSRQPDRTKLARIYLIRNFDPELHSREQKK